MLETIRTLQQTWLAKLVLAAITIPFALWGIESYVKNPNAQDAVATVGKENIGSIEFNEAVRRQLDQFKNQFGNNIDASIMDNPEMRKGILDQMIDQKLFAVAAQQAGVKVTDAGLRDRIANEQTFQENGVFVPARYETFLKASGKTATMFEAELRRDMERNQFANSIGSTGITSKASVTAFMMAAEQSRDVAMVNINPEQFTAQVKVTPEQVKAYYDGNVKEFTIAEQVKPEYVELSIEALAPSMQVAADDVKKYYEANSARYVVKEQRKASHILINAAPSASEADKKAAKAKADSLYEQAKKDIKSFADLAKKNSQDPGSGAAGGDLGFFGRGAMVKPFEEAVFKAKKGDLIAPVLSDFGYHIILVTDIRAESGKSLAEVTPEIEGELKKQRAQAKYAELAEKFSTAAFEQSASLKGAAEVAGVAIKQGPWISKGQGLPPFNNPKLMTALFSDQVIKDKRNSEAVETAPNTLVVARALESKPSSVKPFADVEKSITAKLTREEAGKLAKKDGEAKLAELKAGKTVADLKWPALLAVSRTNPGGLPPQVLDAALKLDAKTVPAYGGAENPAGGYTIVQVAKVIEAPVSDEAKLKALSSRVAQTVSQQEFLSLLAVARTKTDVTIKKDALDKKADGTTK